MYPRISIPREPRYQVTSSLDITLTSDPIGRVVIFLRLVQVLLELEQNSRTPKESFPWREEGVGRKLGSRYVKVR